MAFFLKGLMMLNIIYEGPDTTYTSYTDPSGSSVGYFEAEIHNISNTTYELIKEEEEEEIDKGPGFYQLLFNDIKAVFRPAFKNLLYIPVCDINRLSQSSKKRQREKGIGVRNFKALR